MDVEITCGICDYSVSVSEVSGAQLEYVFDLFHKHHSHTAEDLNSHIWANGTYRVHEQAGRDYEDDEDDDELPG
jgi:cupin superfamily acireductone dioxygenase involved in methionine salvage